VRFIVVDSFRGTTYVHLFSFLLYQKKTAVATKTIIFLHYHHFFCNFVSSFGGLSIDKRFFFSYNI